MPSFQDKFKPTIKDCASDTSLTSARRVFSHTLPKFADMFEDFDESLSLSSHSGGVFPHIAAKLHTLSMFLFKNVFLHTLLEFIKLLRVTTLFQENICPDF